MRARTAAAGARREGGFVLVGVVMMVLALTIIGLSLYSLSGYESQFFGRSLFERQALYTASGGIETVKKLLTTALGSPAAYRLSSASLAEAVPGIVSAVAWQENPTDSTGPVDWGKLVRIRVAVNVHGATRTVEGKFNPSQPNNPYWRLFAATGAISFLPGSPTGTLRATGGAWQLVQSASDSSWINSLEDESEVALNPTACPVPQVTPFIVAHNTTSPADSATSTRDYSLISQPPFYTYSTTTISMDAGADDAFKYFWTMSDTLSVAKANLDWFDYYSGANVRMKVRGTAIWVIPAGAYFEGEFSVERLPNTNVANLIIVAGPNGRHPTYPVAGVWFGKGIATPDDDVNVFIVSNGSVRIEDASQSEDDLRAHRLSVFAANIRLRGPGSGFHVLDLRYRPEMRQVANDLYGRGLLPIVTGMQASTFALRSGSWRESPGLQ